MLLKILINKIALKNRKCVYFFFFPYYHTGGAEKVHLKIVKCFRDKRCVIFFTDRSRNNQNKREFKKYALCINLFGVGNKIRFFEKMFGLLISFVINKIDNVKVFGSNSRFFYSIINRLEENVKIVDIVHWLDGNNGKLLIENSEKINRRVIITPALLPIIKNEYKKRGFDDNLDKRIVCIQNCVQVPEQFDKKIGGKLKILYVGRNTREKRPEIAVKIWKKFRDDKDIEFSFIGRGLKRLFEGEKLKPFILENVKDEHGMNKFYGESHVVFLTSEFEGFPMVFMEAMSYGVVPVSTNVGGISVHVKNGENGMLINNDAEDVLIQSFVESISNLKNNERYLRELSSSSYSYAKENFSCKEFKKSYLSLIEELK